MGWDTPLMYYFSLNPFMVRVTEQCQAGVWHSRVEFHSDNWGGGATDLFSCHYWPYSPLSASRGLSTLVSSFQEKDCLSYTGVSNFSFPGGKRLWFQRKKSLGVIFQGREASRATWDTQFHMPMFTPGWVSDWFGAQGLMMDKRGKTLCSVP